jgi:hypothetical protein
MSIGRDLKGKEGGKREKDDVDCVGYGDGVVIEWMWSRANTECKFYCGAI